jgi:hypothetical protein
MRSFQDRAVLHIIDSGCQTSFQPHRYLQSDKWWFVYSCAFTVYAIESLNGMEVDTLSSLTLKGWQPSAQGETLCGGLRRFL